MLGLLRKALRFWFVSKKHRVLWTLTLFGALLPCVQVLAMLSITPGLGSIAFSIILSCISGFTVSVTLASVLCPVVDEVLITIGEDKLS